MEDIWVSVEEAVKYFSVSPSTVVRWEKRGLPFHKVGRVKRYNLKECNKWFKERSEYGKHCSTITE
jgi:excisionase family DNA binding protein